MALTRKAKALIAAGTSVSTLVAGLAVATGGFSAWSSLLPETQSVNSATVSLTVGSTNTVTTSVSNFVPGDQAESVITLTNSGTVPFSAITLGVSDSSPTALVTNSSGLQLEVQGCSVPWTPSSTTPTTYTCSGTTYTALPSTPLSSLVNASSATTLNVSTLSNTSGSNENYLMFDLSMPAGAPQSLSGLTDTLTYGFTGVQPTGGYIG